MWFYRGSFPNVNFAKIKLNMTTKIRSKIKLNTRTKLQYYNMNKRKVTNISMRDKCQENEIHCSRCEKWEGIKFSEN